MTPHPIGKPHWDKTPQEWREICGCPEWSDEEASEFGRGIQRFVTRFLDEIFRDDIPTEPL